MTDNKIKFNTSIAKRAMIISRRSEYMYKLGCCVVSKNRIVAEGYNKVKTHPKANNAYYMIHAEFDAIKKLPYNVHHSLYAYVCRINKLGILSNAMPCPDCQRMLIQHGVKYVWYTTKNNWRLLIL